MENQESLLAELEIKMDAIIFNYERAFKQSEKKVEEFLKENYETFRSELARVATDTIHKSIIKNLNNDQYLILSIEKLNIGSVKKLMVNLKKIEEEGSKK